MIKIHLLLFSVKFAVTMYSSFFALMYHVFLFSFNISHPLHFKLSFIFCMATSLDIGIINALATFFDRSPLVFNCEC